MRERIFGYIISGHNGTVCVGDNTLKFINQELEDLNRDLEPKHHCVALLETGETLET